MKRGVTPSPVKARIRTARVHARIADRRTDHLHKITTRIVREAQTLVIEDLAVSNMIRHRRLARVIGNPGRRQFRQMLEYKALVRAEHDHR